MSSYPTGPVPPPLAYATPGSGDPMRAKLRTIAIRQRVLIFCILGYIALVVMQLAVPPSVAFVVGLAAVGVSLTAAVFVFMLALTVYNTGIGIVLGILTLIPLIGLIVLLVINSKATGILRQYGINVGLMGADMEQVPSA